MNATLLRLRAAGGFMGDTDADRALARFCADVAEGVAPDPAYLRLVGEALQYFLASSEKTSVRGAMVGKALGVGRKQGKALSAVRDAHAQARAVVDYQVNLESMDATEAVRKAAAKHNICERAMRDRIRKFSETARGLREMDEKFLQLGLALQARFGSEKET